MSRIGLPESPVIVVSGSRTITDYEHVAWVMDAGLQLFAPARPALMLLGGARGVDELARQWAVGVMDSTSPPRLTFEIMFAKWEELGRRAGLVRNHAMFDKADAGIIVWDGESKGTQHMLALFEGSRKPYLLVVAKESTNG